MINYIVNIINLSFLKKQDYKAFAIQLKTIFLKATFLTLIIYIIMINNKFVNNNL